MPVSVWMRVGLLGGLLASDMCEAIFADAGIRVLAHSLSVLW